VALKCSALSDGHALLPKNIIFLLPAALPERSGKYWGGGEEEINSPDLVIATFRFAALRYRVSQLLLAVLVVVVVVVVMSEFFLRRGLASVSV
jgi:hypothetical protein